MRPDEVLAQRAEAIVASRKCSFIEAARQAARELPDAAKAWSVPAPDADDTAEAELHERARQIMFAEPAIGYSAALRRAMSADRSLARCYSDGEPWKPATAPRQATAGDVAMIVKAAKVARMDTPYRVTHGQLMPLRVAA